MFNIKQVCITKQQYILECVCVFNFIYLKMTQEFGEKQSFTKLSCLVY